MRIKIKITEEFINSGRPRDPYLCPISLYLNNLEYKYVRVCTEGIMFCKTTPENVYIYYKAQPSKKMRKFIGDFDTMKDVAPQNFIINAEVMGMKRWEYERMGK